MLGLSQIFHRKESAASALGDPFASLSVPAYRAFWISLLASYIAMQMNFVTRGYLAYVITGSATALGVVSLARGVSMLVLSPFAGVVADKVDKKVLLVVAQSTLAAVALTTSLLVHFHLIQLWHLVALAFVEGTVFSFNMPTRNAILPQLVPHDRLANAIALNASGRNLMRIVGPSIAGLAIGVAFVGISGAFDMVAVGYVVATILLIRLETLGESESPALVRATRSRGVSQLGDGFRYIFANSKLRLLVVLGFVPVVLGNPYSTLLPVFQARVLDVDATGLGMLYGAAGVGGLIGSIVVASLAASPRKATIQLGFGIMFGAGLLLFALVHIFAIDLLFLVAVGMAGDSYSTLNSTMMMLNTDKAWYGRVMGVYMMNWSLMPLATLPLGALADMISAPYTVAIASTIILILIACVALFYPAYRKVGEVRLEQAGAGGG
ncbi:MAG TPA: MFS transporter [Chloroflexota bacterium]|nr:MFS transporter [Chloroflexota bacterium]